MTNLKQKTVTGIVWSFIENFSRIGIEFIVGIILARILSPKEFGLIGMITVFIAISQSFIDSGFSNSLIRKNECSQKDYSTVFYFNLFAGLIFYLLLYFLALPISNFYNEPELIAILRVVGLVLIISSLSIIQRTILTKRVDFKLQTKISIISSVVSGCIAIYMAYSGFGVWSLVWKTLLNALITSILLWLWNKWHPIFLFNYKIFVEHFNFGYKLLISGVINTVYQNIYYLIIGKYFSAVELGYYTKAQQFSNLPSSNITNVISRVSYPVLSQIQNNPELLKQGYKKLIKSSMFISFLLMIGMAAISKSLILTLIGIKWESSILYLQLLCFSAMLYPLHALNLNILNVKGRSDLFLKLEIFKKLLAIPIIIMAIFWGVKAMLFGIIINSFIAYFLNSFWTRNLINYSVKEQINDIMPSFLLALLVGLLVYSVNFFLIIPSFYILIIQIILGLIITLILSESFKPDGYIQIKSIILSRISFKKNIFDGE